MFDLICQDWVNNPGNHKARFILVLFRLVNPASRKGRLVQMFYSPLIVFYKILVEWVMCVELHWRCNAGPGLRIFHGYGLVVHSDCVLGAGVALRNGVTIGMRMTNGLGGVPKLGDNVDIGANACILGGISIGNNVKIGAGAVVLCDVPDGAVAVGNPARIIVKDD